MHKGVHIEVRVQRGAFYKGACAERRVYIEECMHKGVHVRRGACAERRVYIKAHVQRGACT